MAGRTPRRTDPKERADASATGASTHPRSGPAGVQAAFAFAPAPDGARGAPPPAAALDEVFERLAKVPFRQKFALRGRELAYLQTWGIAHVLRQAAEIVAKRLAPAEIANDGRQTPWRNHPVFVAQHATATCCRGCLAKTHGIAKGHELTADELTYVLAVLERWLRGQA